MMNVASSLYTALFALCCSQSCEPIQAQVTDSAKKQPVAKPVTNLPLVVADVLKNPRLKSLREYYGSPGDKRYALVNSPAWTWKKDWQRWAGIPSPDDKEPKLPKEGQHAIPGFQLTPAKRAGQRLLGIRVEKY